MNNSETIVISAEKEAAEEIRARDRRPGWFAESIDRRKNLDGSTAAWIVIASLAVRALPPILSFIQKYLESKRVKKIKIRDLEIENPTPGDIERFRVAVDGA